MESLQRARFNIAITPSVVISIIVIIFVIAIGYAMMSILGSLDIIDDPVAKSHINNTTAYYTKIVTVLLFAIIVSVLFILVNEVRGK